MKKVNQFSVTCQYWWQVKELKKCYPDETSLVSWPYGFTGVYVVSISTYGEYTKLKMLDI